jgi:hypothetical protein
MANFQTALETMTVKESDNLEVLWHGPVRFERSAKKTDQNATDLPKFLHELCSALSQFDPHFQFRDKHGQILSMDALPSTQALCESFFNYQVIEKRNVNHMLFVADIISSKPIGQLKNAVWTTLRKYGIWMFRHELSISRLDVGTAGWMLGVNPRYHSPDLQRQLMKNEMEQWWLSLTADVKVAWERKLKRHNHGQPTFPDFYCNPKSVKGSLNGINSSTSAFNIIAAADDTQLINEILTETFPPDRNSNDQIGMYIPMALRRRSAAHFLRLIQHQQEYLDNYQIVSVAGISKDIMKSEMVIQTASGENQTMTVQAALQLDPSIQRIDPGSYLLRLGKWNVSSTKTDAEAAKKWIDTVLEAMPTNLRHNSTYASFPTAARMKALTQPTATGYATLAGAYSMDSLKAHQDARDQARARPPNRNPLSQNPQEPESPSMAIFTPAHGDQTTYASVAHSAGRRGSRTGRQTSTASDGSRDYSTDEPMTTIPPSIAQEIAHLKTSVNSLQQNNPTTPATNDSPTTPMTPNIMQMFQQLSESMQTSTSQMTKFHQSMETKVQTIESSILDIHKVNRDSKTTSKTFQADVHQELRALRADNNALHSRIDNLSQKPSASPRRKKYKERHKSAPSPPPSPDSDANTVTFYHPPTTSTADTAHFLFQPQDGTSEGDSDTDSDEEDTALPDPTGLADHDDSDPLNEAQAMQTDPADPGEDS